MNATDRELYQCPVCQAATQNTAVGRVVGGEGRATRELEGEKVLGKTMLLHLVYRCEMCGQDTYFLAETWFEGRLPGGRVVHDDTVVVRHRYPLATMLVRHDSIPREVVAAALEAEKCLAVGASNAAGVMSRRAVHAICADKGAQGKDLFDQLDWLKTNHVITPNLWEWAEELRTAGKVGAHPEWEEMTLEEAEYAVKFLRELLRYLYINPADLLERRLKDTKGKKQDQ